MIGIVSANAGDAEKILALYRAVAARPHGLARRLEEIDLAYVQAFLAKSAKGGVALVATDAGAVLGEIHAARIGPAQFAHVLSDITVAVHPDAQGKGIGAMLFDALFVAASALTPAVSRFELMVREGNAGAIGLYERLGFCIEGRFEARVRLADGTLEADIAMARVL